MRIHWVITILLLCAAAAAAEPVRSAVAGRVADPSGAVIPAAKVSLKDAAGREAALTYTDRQGNYVLRVAEAGEYTLLVEAPEFASFTKEGLELDPGRMVTVDVTLQIEAHPERITVTSKAPRGEEALETRTGNAREVLEIREIRESQAKDAGEALSSLDGIWKIRKGGIANDVVLRGFQSGNLNMLVDGVRIHGACPNHMDPAAFHVDFAELEQVEVTKGAFDITNQGSLGGVVNLVSKTPGRGLHVTPNYGAGSFGYQNPSVTGSLSGNRLWGVGCRASMRRSDPFHDGDGRPFTRLRQLHPARGRAERLRHQYLLVPLRRRAHRGQPLRGGLYAPVGGRGALSLPAHGRRLRQCRPALRQLLRVFHRPGETASRCRPTSRR